MTPPEQSPGKQQDDKEQVPAARDRVAGRRRWIKAVGLAAVPLIITVKAQPAFAKKPDAASGKSGYG
jgi:hypothetical protein